MMTRTDFKAIAEIIRKYNLLKTDQLDLYNLVQGLCIHFKKSNPSFDKGKFMREAGWYQE